VKLPRIPSSEITPKALYLRRREFLAAAGAAFATVTTRDLRAAGLDDVRIPLRVAKKVATTTDAVTPYSTTTTYNNFYEFGSTKDAPSKFGKNFKPKPWSVAVEGFCGKPGTYSLEDILKPHSIEERVYCHRCVEGWSIVVPWDGFSLGDLLKRFEPTGDAKFVEFLTIVRPDEMPGQKGRFTAILPWPYVEGLRIDEAMHPLTMLAVGLYGEELPNQNGAPLRLVVPWKYGFKSIKSIVKIRFTNAQTHSTWMKEEPLYYGFYANVNPLPTNSTFRDQSVERRLGEFIMRKTLPFNGYADQVGSMYTGLDLRRNF